MNNSSHEGECNLFLSGHQPSSVRRHSHRRHRRSDRAMSRRLCITTPQPRKKHTVNTPHTTVAQSKLPRLPKQHTPHRERASTLTSVRRHGPQLRRHHLLRILKELSNRRRKLSTRPSEKAVADERHKVRNNQTRPPHQNTTTNSSSSSNDDDRSGTVHQCGHASNRQVTST